MESCLKIAAFFKEDPVHIFELAGRHDLIKLHRKLIPEYRKVSLSEDDLYEKEEHIDLHRGLQRILERGFQQQQDVDVGVDILKRNLDALLASEQLFRALVETVKVVPWEADVSMEQFRYVGPQAERLLGFSMEECYSTNFWKDHLHPDDRDPVIRFYKRSANQQKQFDYQYRMLSRRGKTLWLHDTVSVVNEDDDGVSRLRGFLIDVTHLKETEQQLRESEERYRSLVELSPEPLLVSKQGQLLYSNPAAVRFFAAKDQDQLLSRRVNELIHPDDLPKALERMEELHKSKKTLRVEERFVRLDGKVVKAEISAVSIPYRGDTATQTVLRKVG